ncbi:hypothetical protein [Alkalihalobacterium chitinilyticum]|uniref:Uncharacterized protein n=1 Tax=Alkalihalobacterium chitinilyticum TaxID=2980103 RepID=A0ABT5V950_9BACI|nr:hypothetical protein [Alkalihalobacterium chitinilyticum]MDE5411971.1 hypothetical protein [Alkalihalobacterium chitinilyticum]
MNKKQLVLAVSIGFLVIFSLINYVQLTKISDDMSILRHSIEGVSSSLNDIEYRVSNTLHEFNEEQRWVRNSFFEVKGVQSEPEQVKVLVSWALRELDHNEQLFFLYREQGASEWQQIEVEEVDSLSYEIELILSLKGNYETQILAVSEERKRSEELQYLSIFDQVQDRIHAEVYVYSYSHDYMDLHIMMQQYGGGHMFLEDKELLKIRSAKAHIYVNDKLLETVDVLANSNQETYTPYDLMYEYNERIQFDEEIDELGQVRVELIIKDGMGIEYKRTSFDY